MHALTGPLPDRTGTQVDSARRLAGDAHLFQIFRRVALLVFALGLASPPSLGAETEEEYDPDDIDVAFRLWVHGEGAIPWQSPTLHGNPLDVRRGYGLGANLRAFNRFQLGLWWNQDNWGSYDDSVDGALLVSRLQVALGADLMGLRPPPRTVQLGIVPFIAGGFAVATFRGEGAVTRNLRPAWTPGLEAYLGWQFTYGMVRLQARLVRETLDPAVEAAVALSHKGLWRVHVGLGFGLWADERYMDYGDPEEEEGEEEQESDPTRNKLEKAG